MKKIIKILIIFLIILIIFYFLIKNIDKKRFVSILLNVFNFKIKINNPENLKYINDRVILMSNHYSACDAGIIMNIINNISDKKVYFVAKHNVFGDKNDSSALSNFLGLFKGLYNYFDIIPYEKGNKDSGEKVKNKMLEIVNQNNTVILFPEGTTSRKGIPSDFKPGSFKLCADNFIKIIPITIEYNKRIGMNQHDQFDVNKWFNTEAILTIHKPVYNSDPILLQNKVYSDIVEDLKKKYIQNNLIKS